MTSDSLPGSRLLHDSIHDGEVPRSGFRHIDGSGSDVRAMDKKQYLCILCKA